MLFTMRCPHLPRTTGDQAARARHGLFSKKKKLLSTQFCANLDPCLCCSLRPETSVLPHRRQIADTTVQGKNASAHRGVGRCRVQHILVHHVNHPKQALQLLKPGCRKMLGPNVGQVDRRVDFLDRPDSSVTKAILQEQVT